MLKGIEEMYNKMVRERVGDIGNNTIIKSEEYCKCQNKIDNLINEIKNNLGKEQEHLIYTLEEIINEQSTIAEKLIYRQAIIDFIELKKALVS